MLLAALLLFVLSLPRILNGLTIAERNELSRKFKYYFKSVRPITAENTVSNQNGTYFGLATTLHVVTSTPTPPNSVSIELFLIVTYVDDRLVLRDLGDKVEIPHEFEPWTPHLVTTPLVTLAPTMYLKPNTGVITLSYKVKTDVGCTSKSWKHPFETFVCTFRIENTGDELLHVVEHRDLRHESEVRSVAFEILDWPTPSIVFTFTPSWLSSLILIYLPSFLIFCVVLFAQWKRRKIQVIVTVAALISIVILLSSRDESRSVNLLDLWLSSTFLHTIFLLIVDLTLPARRVRYTLLIDVDPQEGAGNGLGRRQSADTTAPSSPYRQTSGNPTLGGRKAFMAVQKYAVRKFGADSVETKLVDAAPAQLPVQRQITTSTIGYRKRMALTFTLLSYLIFCLIYFVIVSSIE